MKTKWIFKIGISLLLLSLLSALTYFYYRQGEVAALPYFTSRTEPNRYLKIEPFNLWNQNGQRIQESLVKDKITVVEFFFSTCKTICPVMNRQLKKVYQSLSDPNVLFLSFTVDPETDTPEQLSRYKKQLEITDQGWQFITGSKKNIYHLARHAFELDTARVYNESEDFIHTQQVVLLDQKGFVRGYFDATRTASMDSLCLRIKLLQKLEP